MIISDFRMNFCYCISLVGTSEALALAERFSKNEFFADSTVTIKKIVTVESDK